MLAEDSPCNLDVLVQCTLAIADRGMPQGTRHIPISASVQSTETFELEDRIAPTEASVKRQAASLQHLLILSVGWRDAMQIGQIKKRVLSSSSSSFLLDKTEVVSALELLHGQQLQVTQATQSTAVHW